MTEETWPADQAKRYSNRMRQGIRRHCVICDMEVGDFSDREIKRIADPAKIPRRFAFDYMNHWYED